KQVFAVTPELRAADLTILDVPSVRRLASWGYERLDFWELDAAAEPQMRGSFFAKNAGKATVQIKDKDGKVVKETTVDALRGFNSFSIGLRTSPPRPLPAYVKPSKDPKDALKDLREGLRPTFLAAGDYTVEITLGTAKVTKEWKLN
ncbi:MAG: hypothetical protein ACOYON_09960, partial [Fimbriimonas sp.]